MSSQFLATFSSSLLIVPAQSPVIRIRYPCGMVHQFFNVDRLHACDFTAASFPQGVVGLIRMALLARFKLLS
jgi:hypothetical protein